MMANIWCRDSIQRATNRSRHSWHAVSNARTTLLVRMLLGRSGAIIPPLDIGCCSDT